MKRLAALCALITLASPAAADTLLPYDFEAVRAHCAAAWGDDLAMRQYCEDEAEEGFLAYSGARDRAGEALIGPFDRCEREWQPEWGMVAYCASEQIEGLVDLAATLTALPEATATKIGTLCNGQWAGDFAMLAYCAAEQAEAWRRLKD